MVHLFCFQFLMETRSILRSIPDLDMSLMLLAIMVKKTSPQAPMLADIAIKWRWLNPIILFFSIQRNSERPWYGSLPIFSNKLVIQESLPCTWLFVKNLCHGLGSGITEGI